MITIPTTTQYNSQKSLHSAYCTRVLHSMYIVLLTAQYGINYCMTACCNIMMTIVYQDRRYIVLCNACQIYFFLL